MNEVDNMEIDPTPDINIPPIKIPHIPDKYIPPIKIPHIPDKFIPDTSEDCKSLINEYRIRQGKTGICWFASLMHIFNLSDRFRFILTEKKSELIEVLDELNTLANKPCTCDPIKQSSVKSFIESLRPYHGYKDNYILYEYFSPTGIDFCNATPYSGGFPLYYIMPYLVKLGFELSSIKHVISDLDKVRELYFDIDNRHPRKTKYIRVLSDYIKDLLVLRPRDIDEETDILIFTILHQGKYLERPIDRKLFIGKYIMFIHGDYIYVFRLEAMTLTTLNDLRRRSGHAMCAISCNQKGFIVNTYDQENKKSGNDCGLFEYNWYKWNPDYIFSHSFNDKNECTDGKMIKIDDIQFPGESSISNFLVKQEKVFYYHRNVGDNSFFYVIENKVIIDRDDVLIHYEYYNNNFKNHKPYFISYVLPYFLYYTWQIKDYIFEISYEDFEKIKPKLKLLIEGIGYDPDDSTKDNWGYYKLSKNKFNNEFFEIIPEDFRIYYDTRTLYILVEYTVDFLKGSYGGRIKKVNKKTTKK